jgi:putative NADH-flavin reductase
VRIVIFGATGGTGKALTEAALRAGHQVTTVVRNPDRLAVGRDRVRVVQGDVLDPPSFAGALDGVDAVCSALGAHGRGPTTVYSAGTNAIIAAMRTAGLRRLIVVSAATLAPRDRVNPILRWIVLPILDRVFAESYADMRRMEREVRASHLDWTILRPPRLLDGPATGHYRTATDQPLAGMRTIRRADLAAGILDLVNDPSSIRAAMTIAH